MCIRDSPQIDPATRTVKIRARLESGSSSFFPGAFVEATVTTGSARTSLGIPRSAVINWEGGDIVFAATGADEFTVRPVVLGQPQGEFYEVVSGLSEGEEIAVAGVFLLKSALVKSEGGEG